MLVVMVNKGTKKISSRQGMALTMETSPFYALWPDEVVRIWRLFNLYSSP